MTVFGNGRRLFTDTDDGNATVELVVSITQMLIAGEHVGDFVAGVSQLVISYVLRTCRAKYVLCLGPSPRMLKVLLSEST